MAANTRILADDDGAFSDWIEIHNPDESPVSLAGWYLTDAASNKTKWQLPAVTLPAGGYLVVFASNKDRANPAGPLHTNFALSAGGEYLGLIGPDGATVASEFAPSFPAQADDISYGRVQLADGRWQTGFLRQPTPGASNGGADAVLLIEIVSLSRASGIFTDTVTIELAGAGAGQQIRYVAAGGPNAGSAEVTADSPLYDGPLTLNSTTLLRAAVFSADGTVRGLTTSGYYLKAAGSLAGFGSKLPIVVLDDLGAGELGKDGIDHPAWLFTYSARPSAPSLTSLTPDFVTPLVATVRGATSAEFPKKSYNLKLQDSLGGRRSAPLLGLPAYERWALVAPWAYDQNFINNAFMYELSNRIGRWAPRTRLAEIFFNTGGDDLDTSDYGGIHVLTDRIRVERGRVDINELSANDVTAPAVTGGYIVKIDPPDPDEIAWRTDRNVPANEETSIVLVAPDADDIVPAQLDYIQAFIQRMENALHSDRESGWRQRTYVDYIDRASWVDHHMLNALASNPDALYRSAYFTKPRGGKLQAGPLWDFDRALGGIWDERTAVVETWSGIGGRVDIWRSGWWGVLAEDPEFVQDWIDRWQNLRTTRFATNTLAALAQDLANIVGVEAATREAARWPDNASAYGSYTAQIDALKDWLTRRTAWIDAQFVARPTMNNQSGTLTFTPPEGAQLAYTLDGTDPRLVGGEIAPNAQLTSEPLSVAASANIHVRSYNSSIQGGVPSSPWSSSVSGPLSSPLTPHSRLVNLSSRAVAGANGNALVVGLTIADAESKRYLARGVGPGLAAFGTGDTLGEPRLSILNASGVELLRNIGWQNSAEPARLRDAGQAVGAFPLVDQSGDSALIAELAAGAYSIEVATTNNQPGAALAELYELDASGRTANLSTRGRVTAGGALVGGFVVQGSARKRLLIRAIGPTLTDLGLADALADPVLTLYSGNTVVATNDRWIDHENAPLVEAAGNHVGAFPLSPEREDAALWVVLPAGAYTLEVKGQAGSEGIALLEIYELP